MKKILFAGESWMSHTTHVKGFDTFFTSVYESGEKFLKAALEEAGYEVCFMPNHVCMDSFPFELSELKEYSCIILSDIGANTLLLPTMTFSKSEVRPNRCNLIRDYVLEGGALLMVGGYMTFSGIDGKGKWGDTAVSEVLPVELLNVDDRMEHCEGIRPVILDKKHSIFEGIDEEIPLVLCYNKTIAKKDALLLSEVEGNPFIAYGEYGKGKSAVVTTDCAPHWAPPEFCGWKYYNKLWANIVNYITR